MQRNSLSFGIVALAAVCGLARADEGTTSFLHVGKVARDLAGGAQQCEFEFTLWDAPEGGERIGKTLIFDGWEANRARVPLQRGSFEVVLDFGVQISDDEPVYVESRCACGRNAKWATFSRVVVSEDLLLEEDLLVVEDEIERATPLPLSRPARIADLDGSGELAGSFNNTLEAADGDPNPAVVVDADGNTTMIGDLAVGGALGTAGDLTVGGVIEVTGPRLDIEVNGVRALRFEFSDPLSEAPNVIGGSPSNSVVPLKAGAVIAGGGSDTGANQVSEDWGTVSGGRSNHAFGMFGTVGGGSGNTATGEGSTVSGGQNGDAVGLHSTVGGGIANAANGDRSTVAGGTNNAADGAQSSIGGGEQNTAVGAHATVPGGFANAADADFSFAGGRRAKALHMGSFVWADSTPADFVSTGNDQFLIRAAGGVGIGVDVDTSHRLTVSSVTNDNVLRLMGPDGGGFRFGARLNFGDGDFVYIDEPVDDVLTLFARVNITLSSPGSINLAAGGNVGVKTTSPVTPLHVMGGTDSASTGGGYVTIGEINGGNISIDNNEIMARFNNGIATLFLNNDGGEVQTGADLRVTGNIISAGQGFKIRRGSFLAGNFNLGPQVPVGGGTFGYGTTFASKPVVIVSWSVDSTNTFDPNNGIIVTTRNVGTSSAGWSLRNAANVSVITNAGRLHWIAIGN